MGKNSRLFGVVGGQLGDVEAQMTNVDRELALLKGSFGIIRVDRARPLGGVRGGSNDMIGPVHWEG